MCLMFGFGTDETLPFICMRATSDQTKDGLPEVHSEHAVYVVLIKTGTGTSQTTQNYLHFSLPNVAYSYRVAAVVVRDTTDTER